MKILQRYFFSQIVKSVVFILVAFLGLFAFFDLISELSSVGRGGYQLHHVFVYILLGFPGYIYELMPFAVLIGTIYAMALFASNSEFTIMRVSSLSTRDACWMLAKVGLVFLVFTFLVGEVLTPYTSRMASEFRNNLIGRNLSDKFRTGMWSKDTIRENGREGEIIGSRFMNIKTMRPDGTIEQIKLYEFNRELELVKTVTAQNGHYLGNHEWQLNGVVESLIKSSGKSKGKRFPDSAPVVDTEKRDSIRLVSDVTPDILSVISVDANKMSAYELAVYNRHLVENKQDATSYQIAFWKKIIYPFSVFVMMALALPFAYLHFRSGGVSLKIFTGIMIGVAFILINNLFSHVGLLNTWPPFLTAVIPSVLFLLSAVFALWWVERH
ncbi:LPS export ABC transporter permease LptG [Oxalobacter paraformigenes]|uniref:LPS export ABC transporter permease LptG n=1 Tax=Oxalobacter paraformigenes TaxID=556268 RepID=C3X6U6_9BURK|nr:LPS export ABC transporter permease LptG [Oxalobacter paraformigenes]EEO26859.1 hypothetical protein OFAG_00012 [Oxalobacter paraformigenes]